MPKPGLELGTPLLAYIEVRLLILPVTDYATQTENKIKIYQECEDRIEKSVTRIKEWHHEACRVKTNGDQEG